MKCMKAKALIKILILAAIIVAIGTVLYLKSAGTAELTLYNSRSMMDWKLGGEIMGIASEEDAMAYDHEHFEYFTDANGSGIKSISSNTRYYLGSYRDSYRVIGFSTTADYYSVMGIRVDDSELDAKSLLLNSGYSMNGGGLDYCRAIDGKITVYLDFEHGIVTGMAAFLK